MSDESVRLHLEVRAGAGVIRRRDRGVLRLTGSDRVAFLHRMVTNDVAGAGTFGGCQAALCTPKGKMIADLRIHVRADRVILDTERGCVGAARETLERFVITDDVTIEDRTDAVGRIGVHGPRSAGVLAAVGGSAPDAAPHRGTGLSFGSGRFLAAATRDLGDVGFELFVEGADADALEAALVEAGAVRFGPETEESLRVEAGTPRFGVDHDADTIPPEAIDERAVSYTKGCYPGQETISRMRHVGHANRRLVPLRIDGAEPPAPGAEVLAGGEARGRITSAAWGPTVGAVVALAWLRREALDADALEVAGPDGERRRATRHAPIVAP